MQKELQRAQRRKQPITIIYEDSTGHITQRTIIVKRITNTHVLAYCNLKNQYRQFELSRILATDRQKSLVK